MTTAAVLTWLASGYLLVLLVAAACWVVLFKRHRAMEAEYERLTAKLSQLKAKEPTCG